MNYPKSQLLLARSTPAATSSVCMQGRTSQRFGVRLAQYIKCVKSKAMAIASIISITASIVISANPASAQVQYLNINAKPTNVRGGEYINFTINSAKEYDASVPFLPANTQVRLRINGDISEYTYSGETTHFNNAGIASPSREITLNWPSQTFNIKFEARVSPNHPPGNITAYLIAGTAYSVSPYFGAGEAQVSVAAPFPQYLDITANRQSVSGGEDIVFTINSPKQHNPGDRSIPYLPAGTEINLRLQGDISKYTYDGNITFFASDIDENGPNLDRTIRLIWPSDETQSISFTAGVYATPHASSNATANIIATVLNGTGYIPHYEPSQRLAYVQLNEWETRTPQPLEIRANTARVNPGETITFTIDSLRKLHPDHPAISSSATIIVSLLGNLTEYTYNNVRESISTPYPILRLSWPHDNTSITFDATVAANATRPNVIATLIDSFGYYPQPEFSVANVSVDVSAPPIIPTMPTISIKANQTRVLKNKQVTFTLNVTNNVTTTEDILVHMQSSAGVSDFSANVDDNLGLLSITLPAGSKSVTFTATIAGLADGSPSTIYLPLEHVNKYELDPDPNLQVARVAIINPQLSIFALDNNGFEAPFVEYEESAKAGAIVIRTTNGSILERDVTVNWLVGGAADGRSASINLGQVRGVNGLRLPEDGSSARVVKNFPAGAFGFYGEATLKAGNTGVLIPMVLNADNDVDNRDNDNGFFFYQLTTDNVNGYVVSLPDQNASMRFYDDDPAITLGSDTLYVTEGDVAQIPILVAGGAATSQPHRITLRITDPDDVLDAGSDTFVTVPFPRGQNTVNLTLATKEDATPTTATRSFSVELLDVLADGYRRETPHQQTIMVRDDDAMLTVTPANANVTEGEAVTLTLTINQAQTAPFSVTYATITTDSDTAIAGTDYETVNASVEFLAGETEKTITINTLANDIDVEDDLAFRVVASASINGMNLTANSTITIADNDNDFAISIDQASVEVKEGNAVTFDISLSNPLPRALTVFFGTRDKTAIAGRNYKKPTASVTFTAGETSKNITLTTLADEVYTHKTALQFTFTANATLGDRVLADNATINMTENGLRPKLTLSMNQSEVDEGESFTIRGEVDRPSAAPLSLAFDISFPAGFNFTRIIRDQNLSIKYAGGTNVPLLSVQFPANTTSHEFFRFRVEDDAIRVANGALSVNTLGIPPVPDDHPFDLDTSSVLNITVIDNDADPVVAIHSSVESVGTRGMARFVIDGGTNRVAEARQVAVNITGWPATINNGSHTIPHAFNTTTAIHVTLPTDGTSATFVVIPADSGGFHQVINARLVASEGYTLHDDIAFQQASVAVLLSASQRNYTLRFDASEYRVAEGETVPVTFIIDPPPQERVLLNYGTTNGVAVEGLHFARTTGQLEFGIGEGNKTINVRALQNHVADYVKPKPVNFFIHANGSVNGTYLSGMRPITIGEDDEPPVLSLTAPPRVRAGKNATVRIQSNRTVPPENRTVMVEINGTTVEAIYSLQQGITLAGHPPSPITNTVILPKEQLHTNFVVQAVNGDDHSDNLTPIVVRLLNGTGYMLHPDPKRQVAVIQVQQGSNFSLPDLNTAILPQVVATLLDETATAIAARSHAFFGDGVRDNAGNTRGWQRLTIGGDNVRDFAETYARGEAQREANENPWDAPDASRLTQLPDAGNLRFNLGLRGGEANGVALWGQSFRRTISGADDARGEGGTGGAGGIEFEGDVPGTLIGIEARGRQSLLLGIGFSDISAKFDYTRRDDAGDVSRGTHETDLAGYHPYVAWRLRGGGHAWATLGVSDGEVTIRQNGVAAVYRGEVEAETASIGFNRMADNQRQADASGVSLNFHGDVSYASITETPTAATRTLAAFDAVRGIDLSIARVRFGATINKHGVLNDGSIFRRSLDLAVRHDSGDILEGGAVEVGASLALATRRGLTIDLSVRTLLFHEESLDDVGVRGRIAWATPGANGRGLQLVLAPQWGNTESGSDALLDGEFGAYRYYAEADARDGDDDASYAFDVRYGIPVFRGGLLTPFITGDAGDIAAATYGSLFSYGDFTAGFEAVAGDEGKAFSKYSRDF